MWFQCMYFLLPTNLCVQMFPITLESLFADRWHAVAQVQVSAKRKACRRSPGSCEFLRSYGVGFSDRLIGLIGLIGLTD